MSVLAKKMKINVKDQVKYSPRVALFFETRKTEHEKCSNQTK